MKLSEMDRNQSLTLIGVIAVILGILVIPPAMQHFYGYSAVRVAFVIIVIYAGISYYMKKTGYSSK